MADKLRDVILSWVGTPFKHQGRIKGYGVDCVGVVMGVMRDTKALTDDELDAMEKRHRGYGRSPSMDRLRQGLQEHHTLIPFSERQVGDVFLMKFEQEPQHLAIYVGNNEIVHAYSRIGRCVHHALDAMWFARIVECYRLKGAADE